MFAPPFNQGCVIGQRMSHLPINLRNIIINPALFYPIGNIGIQVVVILQTIRITAGTVWRTLLIPIDTKRTDTKANPRFI